MASHEMNKRCYYETLGIQPSADDAAIKRAFRNLAKDYHPDRNPNDSSAEQRFKEVNEAYDVLKDRQKRAAYDRFGHAAFEGGAGPGHGGFDFASNFSDVFEDLFGEFMGGGRRRRSTAQRGADLKYSLEVSLVEAFRGSEATITVPAMLACEACSGSGAEPGTEPELCPTCGGIGKVRTQQGFFLVERTCPECQGKGRVIANPCDKCRGAGRVRRDKTLSVKIPKGVEDGTRIRLSGEGESGLRGGPPGDLYIFVSVTPHPLFRRENTTLHCRVPIAMTLASLGGEFEVPAIDGTHAKVKVPAGTQTGHRFRIRGKGMPQLNTGFVGDLSIEVAVETPVRLSAKQKKLLQEFAGESDEKWSPEAHGYLTRIREIWDEMTD